MKYMDKSWHEVHEDEFTFGDKLADKVASFMGSWRFIIIQSIVVGCWIIFNIIGLERGWDHYPFILLNLIFSTQAAYAAPVIMMAQNRQNARDRHNAEADYETNRESRKEIEIVMNALNKIDQDKLDKIIKILESK